jgi:hypothetical protein
MATTKSGGPASPADAPAGPTAGQRGGTAKPRRSHVPGAGSAAAEAVERARREMLHEGSRAHTEARERREKRARIGADVVV